MWAFVVLFLLFFLLFWYNMLLSKIAVWQLWAWLWDVLFICYSKLLKCNSYLFSLQSPYDWSLLKCIQNFLIHLANTHRRHPLLVIGKYQLMDYSCVKINVNVVQINKYLFPLTCYNFLVLQLCCLSAIVSKEMFQILVSQICRLRKYSQAYDTTDSFLFS